jgi:hypothetical protein
MVPRKIQATAILRWAIVAIGKAYSKLGVLPGLCPFICITCFMLLVMGLGPRFFYFSS